MPSPDERPVLEISGITKHYGHIHALRGANLDIYPGEIVGLVGDNGAGKSTLIKIISGVTQPTSGVMKFAGEVVRFVTPADAQRAGIETVFQDLALALDLPVWANLYLGRERLAGPPGRWFGLLDRKSMIAAAEAELAETRIRIPSIRATVGSLSGGQRQSIAVARAASRGSRLVLMDEPTAALGVEQQEQVGQLVRNLAGQGIPVMLISHNIPQVREICHRVLVMFQGRIVASLDPQKETSETIIRWITGVGSEVPDGS